MSESDRFAKRFSVDPELQVMEVDLSDITFDTPEAVHAFYGEMDRLLEEKDRKWFFLINYRNCRIMSESWISFAHYGKKRNLTYSLGSARYAVRDDMAEAIVAKSKTESFDPNMFPSREAALARLQELRRQIPEEKLAAMLRPDRADPAKSIGDRITFLADLGVMEVDYSHYTFDNSATVNEFYDEMATQLSATDKKWYFMVNYEKAEILPEAWYTWALRGKKLNMEYSLGTVRFDPSAASNQDILKRARADEFNPNLVSTRDEALARLAELKREAAAES